VIGGYPRFLIFIFNTKTMNTYIYGEYVTEYTEHFEYLTQPILKLLSAEKNKQIIDLGCGGGYLVSLLVQKGYLAYGTDASESAIKLAKQKLPNNFWVQDLTKDDLPDAIANIPFDTIVSTEVIEHLYDPRGYIQFCKKILMKNGGGEIIITTPYHGYLKNLVLALTNKMDNHFSALWDGGHIKFWSRATLTTLLEESGFTVTDFVGCGRFPYLWKSMLIKAKI
jgi:2-polyprenyl-3-methyl-5-hydroxy-6-metoxy-1,4-benzoquinol methylase